MNVAIMFPLAVIVHTAEHFPPFVLGVHKTIPAIIPQDRRLFLPINGTNSMADPAVSSKLDPGATLGNGVSSRYGMCVDKVTVTVSRFTVFALFPLALSERPPSVPLLCL